MGKRRPHLVTPVAHRTGSDIAASAVLKASHAAHEIVRIRVLDSVVVRLAFGLTISDPAPGFPMLSLLVGPSAELTRAVRGLEAEKNAVIPSSDASLS